MQGYNKKQKKNRGYTGSLLSAADDKELCPLPADGKAATWQLPVQPGGTGLAYMVALPSAGRRQRCKGVCRPPTDGKATI